MEDSGFQRPEFMNGSQVVYVADVFDTNRDLETHCRVARCSSFAYNALDEAVAEYRKATQKLTDTNSATRLPILQATLLELASAEEVYDTNIWPKFLHLLNEYIAQNQSNHKAYSRLGVVLWNCGRKTEAIQALTKALDLEPTDSEGALRLIGMMMVEKRYLDIASLLDTKGHRTISTWILSNLEQDTFHENIFYAGLVTGKLPFIAQIYQMAITQISADSKLMARFGYDLESARLLARRWLALLYQRYAGKLDRAFHLYRDILLQSAAFWKLGQWNSFMDSNIIPTACDNFAELIYEKASSSYNGENGQVATAMIMMLERLRARQAASEASTGDHWKIYSQKNLNVLLSKLYVRCGRNSEAQLLLREQLQRGLDLLQDDLDWNDAYGFQTLSKVLTAYGREDDARIALSLRQISEYPDFAANSSEEDATDKSDEARSGPEENGAEGIDSTATSTISSLNVNKNDSTKSILGGFICAAGQGCQSGRKIIFRAGEKQATMWTCTNCIQVDFCDDCYNSYIKNPETGSDADGNKRLFICNPCHKFLKTPSEDWGGMTYNGVFIVAGKEINVQDWLDAIEAEFKDGRQISNAYHRKEKNY